MEIDPISVVSVDGPWRVPFEFEVYYSNTSYWPRDINPVSTGSPTAEANWLGRGWSHTLSEAIVLMDATGTRYDPSTVSWGSGGACSAGPSSPTGALRVLHRGARGRGDEFGFDSIPLGGTISCSDIPASGGVPRTITFANSRGAPYSLTYVFGDATDAPRRWRLRDLRTGIITTFDAAGRITGRFDPIATNPSLPTSDVWYGWQAYYDGTGQLSELDRGPFNPDSTTRTYGHRLYFTNDAHRNLATIKFQAPGAAMPTTAYATFSQTATDTNTFPTSSLAEISIPSRERDYTFGYRPASASNASSFDLSNLARVTLNTEDLVNVVYTTHPLFSGACNTTEMPIARVRAVADRTGGWEFRRDGSTQQDPRHICSGSSSVTDPEATLANPCNLGAGNRGVAVLIDNNVVTSGGSAIACISDADCPINSLCSELHHSCVRYTCTQYQNDEPGRDQLVSTTEGCGCLNAASMTWVTIGTGNHSVDRVSTRTTSTNEITWYAYDDQGRLTARCQNAPTGANTLTTTQTTCPSVAGRTAIFERYTYDSTFTYAPSMIERSSELSIGSLSKTFYTRDASGKIIAAVQQGFTHTNVTTGGIGLVASCTVFEYDNSATGALKTIDGPRGGTCALGYGTSTDPILSITPWPIAAVSSSGQVQTLFRRSERADGESGTIRNLQTTLTAYDNRGRPWTIQGPGGSATTLAFNGTSGDAGDRLLSINQGSGTTALSYEPTGLRRLQSVQRPSGQTSNLTTYDTDVYGFRETAARRIAITDPGVATSSADFIDDTTGELAIPTASIISGRGSLNSFQTDLTRDDIQRTNAVRNTYLARSRAINYDATGNVSTVTNGATGAPLVTSQLLYDQRGRVTRATRDSNAPLAYFQYAYSNTSELPTSVTDPNGSVVNYLYDDFGRLIAVSGADFGTLRYLYDPRGFLTQRLEPDTTKTGLTYDRAGRVTRIDYDSAFSDSTAALAGDVNLYWDTIHAGDACPHTGQCTATDGRLAEAVTSMFGFNYPVFYGYDSAGHTLYEAVHLSQNYDTRYTYDTAGRITETRFPLLTGDSAHFSYDLSGIPSDAEEVGTIDAYYNGAPWLPAVFRIEHSADGLANAIWFNENGGVMPGSPSVLRTQYADHSLATMQWRTGANTSVDLGNFTYFYNDDESVQQITSTVGSWPSNYFLYDRNGNITCETTSPLGGATTCSQSTGGLVNYYTYDATGDRRTSYSPASGSGAHTFTIPSNSNRVTSWRRDAWTNPVTETSGNGTRLGGAPGERVAESRPAEGTAQAVSRTYTYYPIGRLREVHVSDARGGFGTTVDYGYDHRGRRVYSVQISPANVRVEQYFFYDLRDHLIGVLESTSGSTTTTQELYYWNETEPLMRLVLQNYTAVNERTYFYNDSLGTVRAAVGIHSASSPVVTYRASLSPFLEGSPQTSTPASYRPVRLRFPGQWSEDGTAMYGQSGVLLDPQFGDLVANGQREFDPARGGYAAVDVALTWGPAAMSAFGYAAGNPLQYSDSTGATEDQRGTFTDRAESFGAGTASTVTWGLSDRLLHSNHGCSAYQGGARFGVFVGMALPFAMARVVRTATAAREAAEAGRVIQYCGGEFCISDWTGYPEGIPRPPRETVFRILEGDELRAAQFARSEMNWEVRQIADLEGTGEHVHEIVPVQLGGNPTDWANKTLLPWDQHIGANGVHEQFWNPRIREIRGY